VISNGVLNLSPLKVQTYREIYRVLKPGGRLQLADIVLKGDLGPEVTASLDAWSD
jgi:ubiquinone/menaquinone biosynthesis C-methylase UbiE